jgi:hypothetical protein
VKNLPEVWFLSCTTFFPPETRVLPLPFLAHRGDSGACSLGTSTTYRDSEAIATALGRVLTSGTLSFWLTETGHGGHVNLSCGNCKAIRSFSGQPPTCDECGWKFHPHIAGPPGAKVAPNLAKVAFAILIVVGLVLFLSNWKFSETRVVTVSMRSSEWIVGEFKTCSSVLADTFTFLDCGGGDSGDAQHNLSVTFPGSWEPWAWEQNPPQNTTKLKLFLWNCQRLQGSDGITSLDCKQADIPASQ